jgi:hypothetical protein
MKTKNFILFLALGSLLFVLADAVGHFNQAWMDGKLLTIMKPDDQRFERISDDSHQNYGYAGSDSVVILAQVAIIFFTRRLKHDNVA